ncbi:MAG: peptidase E [Acidimicrobiales bacterium]|jgi:peptidase E
MPDRHIVATSGGMAATGRGPFSWRFGGLLRYALALCAKQRPRLCFVATATGDSSTNLVSAFGAAAGEPVEPFHLQLFPMPNVGDITSFLCSMDIVWVGGGSVANLLALWRLHGVDEAMRAAWESGVVLAGSSAGSICWHVGGTTDSFGPELQPITNGLGFLPFANGVHYDGEEQRRPLVQRLVAEGTLPLTFATDDGVGLHYVGTDLVEAVTSLPGKSGWRIESNGAGGMTEARLPTRLLDE